MTNEQTVLVKQIGEKALQHDWEVSFNGKSKGNRHLERVQKIAHFLQKHEGGDEFIVLASAWVHDVSLSSGNDNNPKTVRDRTLEFVNQFTLDDDTKNKIADAAAGHEGDMEVSSIESKIVHDADAIDKAGILGIVRHIWKMTNLIKKRTLSTQEDFSELEKHLLNRETHIYTKTGKEIIHILNKELELFFEQKDSINVMRQISELAMEGVISDEIALKLSNSQSLFASKLLSQLQCSYLIESPIFKVKMFNTTG